jgi:hypothetical protein
MKAFKKFLFLLILLIVSCAYSLSIPENVVNEFLKKEFPKREKIMLSDVTIKHPVLKLLGNNKGEFLFDLNVNPPIGAQVKAKIDAIGTFLFENSNKTLYLINLKVKKIAVNGKEYKGFLLNKIVNTLITGSLRKVNLDSLTK